MHQKPIISTQAYTPILSVLMTAYNREGQIGDAIESVLTSSFQGFELIIVDDCSTDDTVRIVKDYAAKDSRIRFFSNETNLGDYPNRNRSASLARGKYIKYVDSDDMVTKDALQVMVSAMEQFPSAGFAFSALKPEESYPKFYKGEEAVRKHFLGGGLLLVGPSSSILKREAFEAIGGFSERRYNSDYEAWLKLCLRFDALVLPPGLMWIREHDNSENSAGIIQYYSLNYKLHQEFIANEPFVFTAAEKKVLCENYRILLARRIFQRIILKYGIHTARKVLKDSGESISLLLKTFKRIRKIEGNY